MRDKEFADLFGNLGQLFDKGLKYIIIAVGVVIALILAFIAIKFLLSHLSMGEKHKESLENSYD